MGKANYISTLQNNAQSKGVIGKASDENTGQKMPQRKNHKSMSGMEILNKLAKKQAPKKPW